jgi:HSP20 family protein
LRTGEGGQIYQQMEIDYGAFERRIPLPDDLETNRASATYEHGLLKVVFPVAERPKRPARVPIEVRRAAGD